MIDNYTDMKDAKSAFGDDLPTKETHSSFKINSYLRHHPHLGPLSAQYCNQQMLSSLRPNSYFFLVLVGGHMTHHQRYEMHYRVVSSTPNHQVLQKVIPH